MKTTQITNFRLDNKIQGFFLCREKHLRYTRSGDLFIDLVLQDSSGRIPAKIWDMVENYLDRFQQNDPVAIKGLVTEFNGILQLTVNQINFATKEQYGKYGYNPRQLVPSVEEPIDLLEKKLVKLVDKVKNQKLKTLLNRILRKFRNELISLPASISHHHPVQGGLLKHIVSSGEIAVFLGGHFKDIDQGLLLTGILLHDIGKVHCINQGMNFDHTDNGKLIGHMIHGWDIVRREIEKIKGFPSNLSIKLEHMILSHKGYPFRESPIQPKFPEALLISIIDEMDGKMDLINRDISEDNNDDWTTSQNHFRTQLWKK